MSVRFHLFSEFVGFFPNSSRIHMKIASKAAASFFILAVVKISAAQKNCNDQLLQYHLRSIIAIDKLLHV